RDRLPQWSAVSRRVGLIIVAVLALVGAGAVWAASRDGGSAKARLPHPVPRVQANPSPMTASRTPSVPAGHMAASVRSRDASRAAALYRAMISHFYHGDQHLFLE